MKNLPKDTLNEREFELVNIIGAQISSNQRDLSRHMDLSLGTINMLIRRLISKGYIRIEQLNKRKVQYILTPKGFTEKMSKSMKYTLKTINSIGAIKSRLKDLILKLYAGGERNFVILGKSDLVLLVEAAFKEAHLADCQITTIKDIPEEKLKGTLLIGTEEIDLSRRHADGQIDLISELAKDNGFFA